MKTISDHNGTTLVHKPGDQLSYVYKVTPDLFVKYPTVVDFAAADRAELEEAVRPTGFYRQKARYIQSIRTAEEKG